MVLLLILEELLCWVLSVGHSPLHYATPPLGCRAAVFSMGQSCVLAKREASAGSRCLAFAELLVVCWELSAGRRHFTAVALHQLKAARVAAFVGCSALCPCGCNLCWCPGDIPRPEERCWKVVAL